MLDGYTASPAMLARPDRVMASWALTLAALTTTVLGMADPHTVAVPLTKYAPGTAVEVALGATAVLGLPALVRLTATPRDRTIRFLATTAVFYLAYQLLVVIPYAFSAPAPSRTDALSVVLPRVVPLLAAAWVCGVGLPDLGADRIRSLVDLAAALLGLWTIVLYVTHGPVFWYEGDQARLRMIWGSSAVLLGWAIIDCLLRRRRVPATIPVLVLATVGLVLTNVRSGYLALLVALLLQLRSGRRQRLLRLACAAGAIVVVVALVQPDVRQSVLYSARTVGDPMAATAQNRMTRWDLSAAYAWHHPLGDRAAVGFEFLLDPEGLTYSSHDLFMEVLVSEGLPGLVFVLLVLGAIVKLGWRYRERPDAWFFFTYLCFYVAFALFNSTWYLAQVQFLFALGLGGLLWAAQRES